MAGERSHAPKRAVRAGSFPRAALEQRLGAGLAALGLSLGEDARRQLIDYLGLLVKWNAVYNLTAIRDPEQMLVQHLLDSLATVRPLLESSTGSHPVPRSLFDIGSGGGLPGIPLAIVWPQARVDLVEPVGKKAAFLRQCAAELGLANVTVHAARVEDLPPPAIAPDLIVCRAFASLADFVGGLARLAGPDTRVVAMKGHVPEDEIAALPPEWEAAGLLPLEVPGLDAARHLVFLRRKRSLTTA